MSSLNKNQLTQSDTKQEMSQQNEHLTLESIRIELFEKDMRAHLFVGYFLFEQR